MRQVAVLRKQSVAEYIDDVLLSRIRTDLRTEAKRIADDKPSK